MTVRQFAGGLLFVSLALLASGCGRPPAAPPAVAKTTPVSTEPGEIEILDAKVTLKEPNLAHFEVRYRFTKGKPDKYYLCDVSFPGTTNHATKPLDTWEMHPEGAFKDAIRLTKPPVDKFEIRLSEADSPQNGYKLISNVFSGKVE